MTLMRIGIAVFVFIECLNVLMLYFQPGSKMGNGVGVFNAYHEAKKDDKIKDLVSYLINWVAGAKLIFIMIGIVVIIFGDYDILFWTIVVLIVSILSFYWRLFPMIRKLDNKTEISPRGYSTTLNLMILSFLVGFIILLITTISVKL